MISTSSRKEEEESKASKRPRHTKGKGKKREKASDCENQCKPSRWSSARGSVGLSPVSRKVVKRRCLPTSEVVGASSDPATDVPASIIVAEKNYLPRVAEHLKVQHPSQT